VEKQNIPSIVASRSLRQDPMLREFAWAQQQFLNSLAAAEVQGQPKRDGQPTEKTAPTLTYLEVYAVISSNHPEYEYISPSQIRTLYDHGGSEMYIVTVELGYGQNEFARFDGTKLREIASSRIITTGGIVVGWYRWWDASGYVGGQFTYQSTSINPPNNTMTDSVQVI
jgi:hypothetical protein